MTTYTMTGPDGKDYSIDGPPGASQEEVAAQMAAAHANLSQAPQAPVINAQLPRWDVLGDTKAAYNQALQGAQSNFQAASQPITQASDILPRIGNLAMSGLNALGVPGSVITGPMHAIGGSLLAKAVEDNPGIIPKSSPFQDPKAFADRLVDLTMMASPQGGADGAVAAPIPKAITPAERGTDYVQGLLANSNKTTDDLRAAALAASGKPITTAEAIGKPGEVAIGALARRQGQTADALGGEMAARQAGAPDRMLDDFSSASGIDPRLAQGDIDSYVTAGRASVKPMFDAALAGDKGVWNADLARLAQRPVVQRAMSDVAEDLRNADIDPTGLGFTAQDPQTGKFTSMPRPTAQAWDMVKKRLGRNVERDQFGRRIPDSQSPGNFNLNKANGDLTSALRDTIPGYGDALDASGDYLSVQKAYNDGQNFILNQKVTAQQVRDHLSGLTDPEKQAFNGGVANKLFTLQQNGRGLAKFADAPSVQAKLSASLGPQNAQSLIQRLGSEKAMAAFARIRAPGAGSPTAEYAAEMGAQDSPYNINSDLITAGANTIKHGPISAALQYGAGKIQDAASMYATRGMPIPVRDAAGKILLADPNSAAALIDARMALPGRKIMIIPAHPSRALPPLGLIGSSLPQIQSQ